MSRRRILIGVLVLLFFCMTVTYGFTIIFQPEPPVTINGPYYDSGPFGNTGSDGACSYYFDPETGASVMTGDC